MPRHADTLAFKPTVNDIARVAGVSLATVDRVLNGRPGVRSVTVEKVNQAIAELGYVRDTAAVSLARRRFYRFLCILPQTDNEFVAALEKEILSQGQRLNHQRTSLTYVTTPPFDPTTLVKVLDELNAEEVDGVAVFGPETPDVRDAVKRAKDRGIAIVALVSDIPGSNRDHFVGIDNIAAGRTAALLMGRFVRENGKILVITGSRLARDHLERRSGFDAVMGSDYPNLNVVASIEGRDDPELILSMLPDIFAENPDIQGVYSSAAGNSGLVRFLEETGRQRNQTVIAHELTGTSREALLKGSIDAIISQDTGHLIRSTTRVLRAIVDKIPIDAQQERIRLDIYVRENIPPGPNQL
ncbi:MAG: LacI family DNA-binding transcriptional regulator [Pseudomonadota bacterium]